MKEFLEFVMWICGVMIAVIVLISFFILPIMYLDGRGKAAYLKKTQGIELKWYEAASLDVKAGSADIKLENVK